MRTRPMLVTIVALVVVGLLGGCGGSSKPAYCSKRTNLENSIKDLSNLNVSSGLSGLQAQLQKIESDANALVSSAKGDFPVQTSAIKTSIDSLTRSVKAVTSTPSAAQIATVASDASTVVSSVKSFVDATSSKC
jgi:cytochrome c556